MAWESERPELLSSMGLLNQEGLWGVDPSRGETFSLMAELSCGEEKELVTVPITVLPEEMTQGERLAERIDSLALEDMENETVRLMEEFEGVPITYRRKGWFRDPVLLVLGGVLAACLWMKEKNDEQVQKKRREESLTAAYPDLVSGFLVLTGAGYSIRQAWKKTVQDRKQSETLPFSEVYQEMQVTLNQMETGTPEAFAYVWFGKRCGLRCYTRFPVFWKALCAQVEAASEAFWSRKWRKPLRYRRTWPGERGRRHLQNCCFPCLGCLESLW